MLRSLAALAAVPVIGLPVAKASAVIPAPQMPAFLFDDPDAIIKYLVEQDAKMRREFMRLNEEKLWSLP